MLLNTGERRKLSNIIGFSALQSIFHFSFFALFRIDYKRDPLRSERIHVGSRNWFLVLNSSVPPTDGNSLGSQDTIQ